MCLGVPRSEGAPLRVLSSFYPVYVAALNVSAGVEGVDVGMMASPRTGCLHDYQLTPGDARALAGADLLLVNGAGMEHFLEKIRTRHPRLAIVEVSEGLPLLEDNPHVWVSPAGARGQVDNVARAFAAADPANASRYAANAAAYKDRISALETRLRAAVGPHAGVPVVMLHGSFAYFAKDLGLRVAAVIESEPGHEPGGRKLAKTIDLMRAGGVKVVFAEPQYSDRLARAVAREAGARVFLLDPVVTGPPEPDAARGAWLAAMETNIAVLRDALR